MEWIRQINLLSDFGNHRYYIHRSLTQVLDLEAAIPIEIETRKSVAAEEIRTGEKDGSSQ
jgi:hypothetical protein